MNVLHPNLNCVHLVEFPSKKLLLSSNRRTLRIWDLQSDKPITLKKEITQGPKIGSLQRIKNEYVAGVEGPEIKIFNVEEALSNKMKVFVCNSSSFGEVFFQPNEDGSKIIANYPGDAIKIWDWQKQICIRTFSTMNISKCKGVPRGYYLKDIEVIQERFIPIFNDGSVVIWLDLVKEEIVRRRKNFTSNMISAAQLFNIF